MPCGLTKPIATGLMMPLLSLIVPSRPATPESFGIAAYNVPGTKVALTEYTELAPVSVMRK